MPYGSNASEHRLKSAVIKSRSFFISHGLASILINQRQSDAALSQQIHKPQIEQFYLESDCNLTPFGSFLKTVSECSIPSRVEFYLLKYPN